MKQINTELKNVIGIYAIINIVNNKMYIGKSKNIYKRLISHKCFLNKKSKFQENSHFINAWHKYGIENFKYEILFTIEEFDENILKQKELEYIEFYKSYDREFGYNLRKDSSTNMICHEETKLKLSKSTSRRNNDPDYKIKISNFFKNFWENNPDKKSEMIKNLSKAKQKYKFGKYDKSGNLICIYEDKEHLINENPDYYLQCIYSVCRNEKKSYKGFIWKYININDDIV